MTNLQGQIVSGNVAQLSWHTLSEQNNKGFEIQRSIDGKHFYTIDFVSTKATAGNSTAQLAYNYTDKKAVNGAVYYRLQQLDIDGKTTLSNIVRLTTNDKEGFEIVAAPKPVNNSVAIKTYGVQTGNATITVSDITGKVLQMLPTTTTETIIDMSKLAQGIYLIKYTDAEHNETIKVSKQ